MAVLVVGVEPRRLGGRRDGAVVLLGGDERLGQEGLGDRIAGVGGHCRLEDRHGICGAVKA